MKKAATALGLLILFFLLLLFPDSVKIGAEQGLALWYHSVVPILFPFILLSNLLVSTESLSFFLQPFFFLSKNCPRLNPWIFYPLFFGLFCGFPMGAKAISDLLDQGHLTQKEASFLLPLVNQASPMFLAGYVGVHILKKELSFLEIIFFLYFPVFLFFSIFLLFGSKKEISGKTLSLSAKKKNSMSPTSEHTIWNSFTVIVTIGIYMMIFSIAVELCRRLLPEHPLGSLLLCSLEFSSGLDQIRQLTFLTYKEQTGFVLALTSFGGFCTAMQTHDMIRHTGLSTKSYLLRKFLLAAVVFLLYSWMSS